MMPTVGLEDALSPKFVSPRTGNVSTAGGIAKYNLYNRMRTKNTWLPKHE